MLRGGSTMFEGKKLGFGLMRRRLQMQMTREALI